MCRKSFDLHFIVRMSVVLLSVGFTFILTDQEFSCLCTTIKDPCTKQHKTSMTASAASTYVDTSKPCISILSSCSTCSKALTGICLDHCQCNSMGCMANGAGRHRLQSALLFHAQAACTQYQIQLISTGINSTIVSIMGSKRHHSTNGIDMSFTCRLFRIS